MFSYIYCLGSELIDIINDKKSEIIISFADMEWEDKANCIRLVCKKGCEKLILKFLKSSTRYTDLKLANNQIFCKTNFGIEIFIDLVEKITTSDFCPTKSLIGDLHMHTLWSDGKHSISEMYEKAIRLGRDYIGITDHSYSLKVARGISEVDALRQINEIRELQNRGCKILSGCK